MTFQSFRENENSAGRISADDDVVRRMDLHDRADRRQLVAANVEAFAGLGVVDVDLPRLRHRAHDEQVFTRWMPLSLKQTIVLPPFQQNFEALEVKFRIRECC